MTRTIAATALAALTLIAAGCSTSSTASSVQGDGGQQVSSARASAADVCESFVKDRLKAPSTASFRDPYGDQIHYSGDGDGPITITATVDSENGFGAKLRSDYQCIVRTSPTDSNKWQLVDLTLDDGGN